MESKVPNNQIHEDQIHDAFEFSGQMFQKQFDPNSILYHQGSQQPVPLGGQNIPKSMPTVYDSDYLNQKPKEIEFSAEYKSFIEQRNQFTNLKQFLNKLSAHMEAIYRHNEKFKEKGNPNNSKHVSILQKNIGKELDQAKQYLNEINSFILSNFKKTAYTKIIEILQKIFECSNKEDFRIQENLIQFNLLIATATKEIFVQSQQFLDEIKNLKGNIQNNEK